MEFSDGMAFDLQGDLRVERRSDGYYVCGRGMLVAVKDREEGESFIRSINLKTEDE